MGNEVIAGGVALVAGLLIGFAFERVRLGAGYRSKQQIIEDAEREANSLKKDAEIEAKAELLKRREELERELSGSRQEIRDLERKLDKRESTLEDLQENVDKRERMVESLQNRLTERLKNAERKEAELGKILKQEQEELYKISGLKQDQATERLLERLRHELRNESGDVILKHEAELKEQCETKAREIIGMAVQRYASAHTSETTVASIDIPNDEMKGRIIGREGRNIRTFEKLTGVDVIVDDTPGVVIISSFDNVRREVGKLALQKLIQDGRIHPTRIEEIVSETQKEIDDRILKLGREAAQEAGVQGLHEKLIQLMGRLNFRVSYSQNVLRHSIEVAHLTGMMAEQLGLDGNLARRCGFTHDIGKAADHEMEGGHPAIGADLLKRYGENEEVVHSAAGHHDDIRPAYIYTVLVSAADAISAARPGARRETLEKYVKRLEELEGLVCGFPGVDQCYAVQAGREVRVVVDPREVNDRQSASLARDIAKAIEETLTYPGEVKVAVLRETRSIDYAR
ncbi:ribonuclease Y [Rubinisphaera brasiliensis]|uniref:Ribonuclease Y n=1 Tax=Rubinisphaera brasiliensis (strain ATCC 49424 / DSM 5305 / JCM 21570 / IAM 15109 / NBRC 103401 / IFAM 1448) TaxID=756272 RepID=F0SM61_RUBBR|nr:ribonuclease Y [Rubinisphaera brasiliensis]ADY61016.1 2,3 cyclic-nucleotide 2-phosphodiesterase [Rubinisphaera brasiliensis DSM 5305]